MRRRTSWRDLPNLREIYVPHLNWIQLFLPFHHHRQLRFTVRDGHGTELILRRVGVGEVPTGFGETFQNSAQDTQAKPGKPHPTEIYLMNSSGPKRLKPPVLMEYLPRLFDHIWRLFLLPISQIIEVPDKKVLQVSTPKNHLFHHLSMCAKIPGAHRVKPKKEAGPNTLWIFISPDEGMDVWIYSHVIFNLEFWHDILIHDALYNYCLFGVFFFPTLFPCHFAMAPAKRSVALLMEGSRGDM